MKTPYAEVLAHLESLQMHKIKLGLAAMQSFLERVGKPERHLRFVHVAGTNGKGSVCAGLTEVLSRAGYRVGLFTSPHLSSVRERFRIGSEYISEAAFAELGARIRGVLGAEQITYFEFTTALALLWFAESKVDLAVLETGMGGRLDATNVVVPLVSVITSVSMDHEAYLGNSLTEIAGEKAGIIKGRVPVVSGALHPEAAAVIARVAGERSAPLMTLGQDFDYTMSEDGGWTWRGGERFGNLTISGLRSNRVSLAQQQNDALTIATLRLLAREGFVVQEEPLRRGLAEVKWPGRMEYFEQEFFPTIIGTPAGVKKLRYLLDGAHNPDGVKNLADTLLSNFRYQRVVVVWGSMGDKDLPATLGTIAGLADELVLTRPAGERSATPEQLSAYLDLGQRAKARCIPDVAAALLAAQESATEEDLIVVGGSLYLIGAIRHLLLGELA